MSELLAENFTVEATRTPEIQLNEGDAVTIVFYNEAHPTVLPGAVVELTPTVLKTNHVDASALTRGRRIKLIRRDEGFFWEAEAEIKGCDRRGAHWFIATTTLHWSRTDARKHPRYPIALPISLVAVQDCGQTTARVEIAGRSHDMSLGGASATIEGDVNIGWLVEFQTTIPGGKTVRALALIARRDEATGVTGIEFVDYIGGSRYLMHSFLSEAA